MMAGLFERPPEPEVLCLRDGFFCLPGFATPSYDALLGAIADITRQAALRHMTVPGGRRMAVAMTNCGPLGWVADTRGYRYSALDPLNGQPWPALPALVRHLAADAAATCGFDAFDPDACLVNHYEGKATLGLHRDADEADLTQPIVSVSVGASARFSIGGLARSDARATYLLRSGDVLVWGGAARLVHHAVGAPRRLPGDPLDSRYNLTLRRAGKN